LRNREAARYAAWAGIAAGAVILIVAGFYTQRGIRDARARRAQPIAVPAAVQQQSAQFSFSKVEQDRTLFTVRASRATQFKDQNRALLEDVWITVYGPKGDRNDNVHTRECSYEPEGGEVRCQGKVQIDIAAAGPALDRPALPTLQVTTSDLSFNRDTGEASTAAPVEFKFAGGQGHGVGVTYSQRDSVVRVQHTVEFALEASDRTGGLPVSATGSALDIRRDQHDVVLEGPANIRQGGRELVADRISVQLDADNHARAVIAEGHPQIHAQEGGGEIAVLAQRVETSLNPAGWAENIVLDGPVNAARESASGTDHFSAAKVEIAMLPGHNLAKEMIATGSVVGESKQGRDSRTLRTEALRVVFVGSAGTSGGASSGKATSKQRIESAETLAPATIVTTSAADTTTLTAKKFVAGLGPSGRLDKLLGHGGVDVRRELGKEAPQTISAAEMAATFAPSGDWNTVDETGGVHFQQADRQVTAAHANFVRATNVVTLDGAPVLSDSMSRTSAGNVIIDQQSGEVRASGGVVSTYLASAQGDSVGLGAGAAHVSADGLAGSISSGHAVYNGHARLWQGDSVLDSDRIELWRDDKRLLATGHVVAVFPQAGGPLAKSFGQLGAAPSKVPAAKVPPSPSPKTTNTAATGSSSAPALWKVVAPSLAYWSDQGKARLEGGVLARSGDASLESRTMDIYLGQAPSGSTGGPREGQGAALGARQLSRLLAQGGAVVRQGDRKGVGEQAEYTAADGKFVLSGGEVTVTDASSNTSSGRSLTFFVANDTIFLDSQEGSRTLTKHRVEK